MRNLLVLLVLAAVVGCAPKSVETPALGEPAASGVTAGKLATGTTDEGLRAIDADGDDPAIRAPEAVPGELLVKFKALANTSQATRKIGASIVHTFKTVPGLTRVRIGAQPLSAALARLRADPAVEYAEPNYRLTKSATIPNDPRFAEQWALDNIGDYDINAVEGWDVRTGASGVVIAVIDSGVDYNHEDLAANIWSNPLDCDADGVDDDGNGYFDDCHGIDTANHDSDPLDDDGHGTHVAGILGAVGNNGVGVAGVAWDVKLLPCKFLTQDGDGATADAIACLDYVAALKDRGVNIVATNNSWGGQRNSQALRDAIVAQRNRGIIFVAASGNQTQDMEFHPEFPCAYDLNNIICVNAYEMHGLPTPSNYGAYSVHVTAPGFGVLSTLPGNAYGLSSGSSMAAPYVSGIVALLAAQDPSRAWIVNRNRILSSGYVEDRYAFGTTRTVSHRRVRLDSALTCNNSMLKSRILPGYEYRNQRRVGAPIDIAAIHVNCGVPHGPLTAVVSPGGLVINLLDDGQGADTVAGDGIYSGRWTPIAAGDYQVSIAGAFNESFSVNEDSDIKSGFPVSQIMLPGRYNLPPYMTVGNISGDSRLEIATPSISQGPVYVWNPDGSPAPGWPILDGEAILVQGFPYTALAELDGDPARSELAAAYYYGDVSAYGDHATVLPGWPQRTVSTQEVTDPTVAGDIDGDGRDEIFVYDLGTELVYRQDGARLPGWAPQATGIPDIADLDGDGIAEFISGTMPLQNIPTIVTAKHADGTVLAGFPVTLDGNVGGQTLVGDFDGDGRNEILVVQSSGAVRRVSDTGVASLLIPAPAQTLLTTVASIGDLDGDGIPEIVTFSELTDTGFARTYLSAYKGDGTVLPGFPIISDGYRMPANYVPAIGDVDGDQLPDIVYGEWWSDMSQANIHVRNRQGVELAGFPKVPYSGEGSPLAIEDLDLNGRNDIIVYGQSGLGIGEAVWVYERAGPNAHGAIEWSQLQGDSRHRGYYELGKNLPNHAFISTRVRGTGRVTGTGVNCGSDCVERVIKGTSVTLTATGSGGHRFSQWLGACAGRTTPVCTIPVSRYTTAVAVFDDGAALLRLDTALSGAGSGAIASAPAGIDCGGDCTQDFHPGASVTLTATPRADSYFMRWEGQCLPQSLPECTVTMDAARSVTAVFGLKPVLTASVVGPGRIESSPPGIDCGADCQERFDSFQGLNLIARPDAGAGFVGWSGGGCSGSQNPCLLTMDADHSVVATFAPMYLLSVAAAGAGAGTVASAPEGIQCGADCSEAYLSGSSVQLTATAAAGSRFTGWSGACTQTTSTCTVVVNAATGVTANFVQRFTLTVTAGTGGSVASDVAGIACGTDCVEDYDAGATVVLTATPSAGNNFSGWTGACSGTASTCTVTLTQARTAGATFAPIPPPAPSGSSGGGSKSGGGGRFDWITLLCAGLLIGLRRAGRSGAR